MKRSAATPSRTSSQQTFSCQFCRARKLKCDRGRPCFNCSSRNNDCLYNSEDPKLFSNPSSSTLAYVPEIQVPEIQHKDDGNHARNYSNLAQRIQRLERAVFRDGESGANAHGVGLSKALDPRFSNQDEEQQMTSQWLEGLLNTKTTASSPETPPLQVDMSSILLKFPDFMDATLLLDHFTKTIDATYRTLHIPTVWRWLDELYADLNSKHLPPATQLAFFLGVFAGSAFISNDNFQFQNENLQNHSQNQLAELWFKQAVAFLTKPPVPPSIQALQTFMNLTHLSTQIEGTGGDFVFLSTAGLQMAKSMRLHRLDVASSRAERRKHGDDMVELEVKRRIWWHMVASDWFLSYVPGPNEGTYQLHPGHMETYQPSNVEDSDIPTGITKVSEESYSKPLSIPTSMTYFLFRIQVATLVRGIIDSLPPSFFASPGTQGSDEVYDSILALDQRFQKLLKSLPPFFRLASQDDDSTLQDILEKYPYLKWQRPLVNFVIHTHLARLHRPFLIRGATQHKYAYSRMQCIKSAETVISLRNHAIRDHSIGSFTYILHHFLMAAIILGMDVHFSPDYVRVAQRKQEILQACRELEEDLNAKLILSHSAGNRNTFSSQQIVVALQGAVQNLRGILRKATNQGESDTLNTPILQPSSNGQRQLAFSPANEVDFRQARDAHITHPTNDNQSMLGANFHHGQSEERPIDASQTFQDEREPRGLQAPDGQQHTIDGLWEEFFTVGSNLNDSDWDTFLLDVGQTLSGIE